jgi:hypothetical protein
MAWSGVRLVINSLSKIAQVVHAKGDFVERVVRNQVIWNTINDVA